MSDIAIDQAMQVSDWSGLQRVVWWVYADEVRPEHRVTSSVHSEIAAWHILKGGVTIQASGKTVMARAGQWLFPWTNRPYTQQFSPGAQILSIRFHLRWITGEDLFDHSQPITLAGEVHPELARTGMSLHSYIAKAFPSSRQDLTTHRSSLQGQLGLERHSLAWVEAYCAAMLDQGQVPRIMAKVDDRVLRAIRHIDAYPLSQAFREGELAKAIGLSVGHLNMLFRTQVGVTPRQQFENRRSEMAFTLASRSAEPLKAIAHRLGFSSQSHFTKWFGHRFNATPSAVRRSQGAHQA